MSENNEETLTPEQIEARLERTRNEMTATVDELVDQLDPRKQAKQAVEIAKDKAEDAQEYARLTVDLAKEGDTRSIAKLTGAAAGVLLLGGLVARRIFKRG